MQTTSFPATYVDLQVGAPLLEPEGNMQIKMKTRKVYIDGTVLNSGVTYTVTRAWGQVAVGNNWASDSDGVLPTPGKVSLTNAAGLLEGVGRGVVLDGDSLSARNWNELAITSASRTGTTATILATGFGAVAGSTVVVNGYSDERWNGPKTALLAPAGTFLFKIDPNADGVPTAAVNPAGTTARSPTVITATQRRCEGSYVWCEATSGINYGLVFNCARGGREISQINADFAYTVGAYPGELIIFEGGTNDANRGIATSVSSAALEDYIVKCLAQGSLLILTTVPPFGAAANTVAKAGAVIALNAEIRRLAGVYGLPVADRYTALIDPAGANGVGLAVNYDSDGIHLSGAGAKAVAAVLQPVLATYQGGMPIAIPQSTGDTVGVLSASNNLLDGFFAGTGGSATGTAVGSVATNWALVGTTAAFAGSKGAVSVGASQIVDLVGAAAGNFTLTGPTVHASMVVGGVYEFVGIMKLNTVSAAIRTSLTLQVNIGGTTLEIRALSGLSATTPLPGGSYSMVFRSEPWTASATVLNCQPRAQIVLVSATTGTVEFYQWAIRRIA